MIKVSVMYPNTPGARFNHEYYRDKHMLGSLVFPGIHNPLIYNDI